MKAEPRPKYKKSKYSYLYDTARWRKARRNFLTANPLCRYCLEEGHTTPAQEVDHIIPHRGDMELFWDSENNWQSLCKPHHQTTKAREEATGQRQGCDLNGNPFQSTKHWR